MEVYLRELKVNWKSLLWWSIGMVIMIWTSMYKYANLADSGSSANELMKQFPKSIQALFGLTGFDLTTASGYFGVLFMYLAVIATIHAVLLGAEIIAKEERDKTSEFLFTKPISRFKVITAKLFAGLTHVVLFNLITLAASLYFVNFYNKGGSMTGDIMILTLAIFVLQLMFFFAGTLCASLLKRPKSASSVSAGVLLFCFILTYMINLNSDLDILKYLTPFKYFEAKTIMADSHLDLIYTSISFVLILIMIFITYRAYEAKDLSD